MQEIGAFEAKNNLGSLLDRVERGEEIIITRHGRPVASLVACRTAIDRDRAQQAADRLRARAKEFSTQPFDWNTLKSDRDEGRP